MYFSGTINESSTPARDLQDALATEITGASGLGVEWVERVTSGEIRVDVYRHKGAVNGVQDWYTLVATRAADATVLYLAVAEYYDADTDKARAYVPYYTSSGGAAPSESLYQYDPTNGRAVTAVGDNQTGSFCHRPVTMSTQGGAWYLGVSSEYLIVATYSATVAYAAATVLMRPLLDPGVQPAGSVVVSIQDFPYVSTSLRGPAAIGAVAGGWTREPGQTAAETPNWALASPGGALELILNTGAANGGSVYYPGAQTFAFHRMFWSNRDNTAGRQAACIGTWPEGLVAINRNVTPTLGDTLTIGSTTYRNLFQGQGGAFCRESDV